MRSRETSPVAGLPLIVVATVFVLGTPTKLAFATDCEVGTVIRGGGGEAGAECPEQSPNLGPADTVGHGTPVAACTAERAADPTAWSVSFVPPQHVPEGEEDHPRVDVPEGYSIAFYVDCFGEHRSDLLWVPTPAAGSTEDSEGIFVARVEARARVEPTTPDFEVSPERAVTRFATWLWLDESYWQPRSARASTSTGIEVSVEARPVEAIWNLDEGMRVCEGPGVPWSEPAQADYELQPETVRGTGNPACTYTFTDASSTRPSGVFDASVTVRWEFSWSLNGVDRGVFGSVEVSDSWGLTVGEVQAVITG